MPLIPLSRANAAGRVNDPDDARDSMQSVGDFAMGTRLMIQPRFAYDDGNDDVCDGPYLRIVPHFVTRGSKYEDSNANSPVLRSISVADGTTSYFSGANAVAFVDTFPMAYDIDAIGNGSVLLPFDASVYLIAVRPGRWGFNVSSFSPDPVEIVQGEHMAVEHGRRVFRRGPQAALKAGRRALARDTNRALGALNNQRFRHTKIIEGNAGSRRFALGGDRAAATGLAATVPPIPNGSVEFELEGSIASLLLCGAQDGVRPSYGAGTTFGALNSNLVGAANRRSLANVASITATTSAGGLASTRSAIIFWVSIP